MEKLNPNIHSNLSTVMIKKLIQNHIITIGDFLQEEIEKLITITKLDLPSILEVRDNIFKQYAAPVKRGTSLLTECLKEKSFLETGIKRLDAILNGGIPTGFITEVCGLAGSGKSQLCMQLAINCVKSSNNTVLYIDTKGDFSSCRIQKSLEATGLSHKEMAVLMLKIKVVYIFSMEELLQLLQDIKDKKIVFDNLTQVIIDSLPCLMFQHFDDDSKTGLYYLNLFVNLARYIAQEFKTSIVCVNIETRWVDQDQISDLDDDDNCNSTYKEPAYLEKKNRCLGKYWHQVPVLVLLLERYLQSDSEQHCLSIVVKAQNYNNPCHKAMCPLSIRLSANQNFKQNCANNNCNKTV